MKKIIFSIMLSLLLFGCPLDGQNNSKLNNSIQSDKVDEYKKSLTLDSSIEETTNGFRIKALVSENGQHSECYLEIEKSKNNNFVYVFVYLVKDKMTNTTSDNQIFAISGSSAVNQGQDINTFEEKMTISEGKFKYDNSAYNNDKTTTTKISDGITYFDIEKGSTKYSFSVSTEGLKKGFETEKFKNN